MHPEDYNIQVNVGGVPEHFNLAWHLAKESGDFLKQGININWIDFGGGTGAMCDALRNNQIDIAIALTEGAIADIINGNQSKILQFYVNSPLQWGVFTGANSGITDLKKTDNLRYAISRFKSGSHLMAYVNADNLQATIKEENFVVVKDLAGARQALANNQADLFMWEKYTTMPYVYNGEFRLLGECHTPWPCFVVMVRNQFMAQHYKLIKTIMQIVNYSCYALKYKELEAIDMIAWRYKLKLDDVHLWFENLEYAYTAEMDELQFIGILNDLKKFKIINKIPALEEVCFAENLQMA